MTFQRDTDSDIASPGPDSFGGGYYLPVSLVPLRTEGGQNLFPRGLVCGVVRVAALFSGGKDSTYAVHVAQQRGWEVSDLVAIVPDDPESMLFHVPNVHLVPLQGEAMGIPVVQERAGPGEDAELEALHRALASLDIDGVVVGAIASDYQHSRVNQVGDEIGLRVFAPSWRREPRDLLRDYLDSEMEIQFVAVAAEGFSAKWLGRSLDRAAVDDLLQLQARHGVHPCGEGGEFETLVVNAPWFRQRLVVDEATAEWKGSSGSLRVTRAHVQ